MLSVLNFFSFLHGRTSSGSLSPLKEKLDALTAPYHLSDDDLGAISSIMLEEMKKGLNKDSNSSADIKMFPTYVQRLPDGNEDGSYIALDLGGTNFRVLFIEFSGKNVSMKSQIYPVSPNLMSGEGDHFFDYIAKCIESLLVKLKIDLNVKIPLGFTFSFPCRQEGLNRGVLISWTKGFNCSGVVGEDVVQLLQGAIKRHGKLNVECVAILNDTVGCLMSCAFKDHDCHIGVILGTGTNACYMERLDCVQLWDREMSEPNQVIINTEWGAFGSSGCIQYLYTPEDESVDSESLYPGKQRFEKLISGMYLGEIARKLLISLIEQSLLLNGVVSTTLQTKDKFFTKYISSIERDPENGPFPHTLEVLKELGYSNPDVPDCYVCHYVCRCVSERAAHLSSAAIATLLNRVHSQRVTVAVDGSLYRYHPHFHQLMIEKIAVLIKGEKKFKLMLSEDGSGIGAAVVAAIACKSM